MARRVTENSLERTARLLTAKHKIKVTFKPGVAETVGDHITLPTLPDNANQELVDAMQGYLDQQAGYVLFSDQQVNHSVNAASRTDKEAAQLEEVFRMVEDVRVEESMEDIYPGSELNFTNAHYWLYNRIRKNWNETDPKTQSEKITKFQKILASTFLERRHQNSDFYNNFIDEEVREKASKCLELLKESNPQSSVGSLETAKSLMKLLEEERKEDEKQRPDPNQQGEDGTEQSPISMKGVAADGDEDSQGQDKATSQNAMSEALAQAAQQETKDKCEDSGDQYGRSHNYSHDLDDGGGYTIYSTASDTIESMSKRDTPTHGDYLQSLRDESRHLTSTMRSKLINTLRASSKRRWVGGRPEGRLDARRAHKAILGISQDVYRKRTKKVHLDTVVALAIDHSGSMSGRPLELAAESALTLGDVFDPLKIPFLIYGYSTRGMPSEHPGTDAGYYARWSNLWIRHYKDYEENWRAGALKLTHARNNCQANTLDGESVLYGIKSLLARPEKRKILMVFNDGEPWPGYGHVGRCQAYLKQVVASGEKAGVEIIAFGIRSQNVKEYYPNYVVINDLDDLVREPLKKIDGMLRGGMLKAMRG